MSQNFINFWNNVFDIINFIFIGWSLYKENYLKELLLAIEKTTPADVQKIANYYLSKPSVISVIASENTLKKNEDYIATLGEHLKN